MKKRKVTVVIRQEKRLWHAYGLQGLRDERFAYVANQILSGRFTLLALRPPVRVQGSQLA